MKLLLVEDDRTLQVTVKEALQKDGFDVVACDDGEQALEHLAVEEYELVILDLMLPRKDGFTVLEHIKQKSKRPIVMMLTARDDVESKVRGLDSGADEYLVKPFSMLELFARIRMLLRRNGVTTEQDELAYGAIRIQNAQKVAYIDEQAMTLTKKEFDLLSYFLINKGRVLTKAQIFERIWGWESDTNEGIVDLYVHYVRKKLQPTSAENYIETVRGVGYKLTELSDV
ncbi:MAG: response regulator transcription factor [Bacilli bacterium]